MALPKRVKMGGSLYSGDKLVVMAAPGDYILNITMTQGAAVNGITVIPDAYGAGDYWKLDHIIANPLPGKAASVPLASSVYNVGANAAIQLDFSAIELMTSGDTFRLTYTNVAGQAVNVYTILERIQ